MARKQIQAPGPLLAPDGSLTAVGWSPHPLLDCNLEQARFCVRGLIGFAEEHRARW